MTVARIAQNDMAIYNKTILDPEQKLKVVGKYLYNKSSRLLNKRLSLHKINKHGKYSNSSSNRGNSENRTTQCR